MTQDDEGQEACVITHWERLATLLETSRAEKTNSSKEGPYFKRFINSRHDLWWSWSSQGQGSLWLAVETRLWSLELGTVGMF